MQLMKRFLWAVFFVTPLQIMAQEVKLMSYNIRLDVTSDGENRWDARKEKLSSLIRYYEPGFIGTQEVKHHQLQYLLAQLPAYSHIGVGRDDGKTDGEYSAILYDKKKFELIKQGTFWLSQTPDSVSMGWDAVCNRVCTYGLFRSNETKKLIWIFNTHFDHVGTVARLESAKLIIEKINKLNVENAPLVLCGDLNSPPEETAFQYFNKNLQDARSISKEPAYGPVATWNAFEFNKIPKGRIDHIFINKNSHIHVMKFATLSDSYDKKYPSDHFPVMATLKIDE